MRGCFLLYIISRMRYPELTARFTEMIHRQIEFLEVNLHRILKQRVTPYKYYPRKEQ